MSRIISLEIRFVFVLFPQSACGDINPFPHIPFRELPEFKEAADDTLNVVIKGF